MSKKVPTNIITGFLGSGKTTAILDLLKQKPEQEKWAVLVNEFGEIGIDGALMSEQGALIKEVPGGCMCCTAGVPMSVGINALLRTQPDRLLIEPTGLGHPKQVMAVLTSEQYTRYVDLKATIAFVDPRNLSVEKYTTNQNFNDQLDVSEVIIGNKVDQCTVQDIDAFNDWVTNQSPAKVFHKLVKFGQMPLEVLDIERRAQEVLSASHDSHHLEHAELEPKFELPPGKDFIRKENKGQHYFSCGWLIGSEHKFDFDSLMSMLNAISAERVKAVMNTNRGCYAFNLVNGVLSVNEMSLESFESRVEVIDSQLLPWDELEHVLLSLCGLTTK
ncbi:GTP-binding protein [Vibrio sp. S4M6]|uniref:CobW family GTP-binding protein n=1 Tax=Vibrio sinus TaxID=2946865 RepID=UPI00202A9F89|nr:GTP-binding protein [Vibrio sinus]MCL9779941.1 GTP-binding protein [Vibrio sinus]